MHKTKRRARRYHEALGCALFVREQALRYAQLTNAVLEHFDVVEIARKTHVPEDGLFEPLVDAVENSVHLDDSELLVDLAFGRLHPEHTLLTPLHYFGQFEHRGHATPHKLDAGLDDVEVVHIDGFHVAADQLRRCSVPFFAWQCLLPVLTLTRRGSVCKSGKY